MARAAAETREGIPLSSLDAPLFDGSGMTKRDLVDYLDAMSARILPELAGRALSVIRVRPGQEPFMQKNLPPYAPDWIPSVAHRSQTGRELRFPVCDDRRTLIWLANQRAVEYHPQLFRGQDWNRQTHLVLDLDPPEGAPFRAAAEAALLVRRVLDEIGMPSAVKTSGAKGVHVVVPLADAGTEDVMAATRAVAARAERLDPALATTAFIRDERHGKVFLDATRSGGATVVACWSPRARPGVPVSYPIGWDALPDADPRAFTLTSVPALLAGQGQPDDDPWRAMLPPPQALDPGLVEEGRTIPVARVQAMHEGKRRAKARREAAGES